MKSIWCTGQIFFRIKDAILIVRQYENDTSMNTSTIILFKVKNFYNKMFYRKTCFCETY